MTLLSIIIPAYNVEKYIKKTIKSVLSQNSKEIEIIVVDDGSTDNTYKIAQNLLKNRKNAKIIRKKNGGVSSARNTGLKHAKGKYVMFLDGDDFVSKDFFKEIKKHLNQNYDILFWKFDRIDESGKILLKYEQNYDCREISKEDGEKILKQILIDKKCWIWTGSIIYNIQLLLRNKLKYSEDCTYGEDLEFIFKALTNAKKVKFINKTLSYYVIREDSITRSVNLRKMDSISAFIRVSKFFEKKNLSKEIIKILKYEIIPEKFISTLTSLYVRSDLESRKEFYKKLKKKYNTLLKDVPHYLERYIGRNQIISVAIKIFLLNPRLYLRLSKMTLGIFYMIRKSI